MNDGEDEILCYDLIGLGYFYLGDLKSAEFFHDKWCFAEIEPQEGYFRNVSGFAINYVYSKTSKKFIEFYEQKIPCFFSRINKTFMDKLSLPIRNMFEKQHMEDSESNFCDRYKVIRFNNCNGQSLIEEIIGGLEFTDYRIEYYEIQKRMRQIELPSKGQKKKKRVQFPRIIMQIKQKYNHQNQQPLSHNIYDNPLYNVPIDQKLKYRMKKQFDITKTWQKVERQIGETRQPYGIRQDQIYIKHVDQKRNYLKKQELYAKRNNSNLTKLLSELAQT